MTHVATPHTIECMFEACMMGLAQESLRFKGMLRAGVCALVYAFHSVCLCSQQHACQINPGFDVWLLVFDLNVWKGTIRRQMVKKKYTCRSVHSCQAKHNFFFLEYDTAPPQYSSDLKKSYGKQHPKIQIVVERKLEIRFCFCNGRTFRKELNLFILFIYLICLARIAR